MAEGEKELLAAYRFYSKLITNFKLQNGQPKPRNHDLKMRPVRLENVREMKVPRTINEIRQKSTLGPFKSKNLRVVNTPQPRRTVQMQRVVLKPGLNELNTKRLILNCSTPKSNNCGKLSPMISPILCVKKPKESPENILTEDSIKAKQTDRVVLKSSRYKWSSKFKGPSSDLRLKYNFLKTQKCLSKSPIKKPSPILKTPSKSLKCQTSNRFKLIRNQSVLPKNLLKRTFVANSSPKFVKSYVVRDRRLLRIDNRSRSAVLTKFHFSTKRGNSFYSFTKNNSWAQQKVRIYKKGKVDKFVSIGDDSKQKKNTTEPNKLNTKMITVRGIKFMLDPFGKTLKRVGSQSSTDQKDLKNKPNLSRIDIGGETFVQTKPGLLVLSQANKTRFLANRSINRSIYRLTAAKKKSKQYCLFYNRFGKCTKKDLGTCPYQHDPDKVAVCTRFLQGKCSVENCPFSHKICSKKMPVCTFFLRGRCNADTCPYSHVNVNPEADNCEDFVKGFCGLAEKCKKLHDLNCAEFQRTGKCTKTKCSLKHTTREKRIKPCTKVASLVAKNSEQSSSALEDTNDVQINKTQLPSFIKLDDTLESNENESTISTPLRIKPQFF